MGDGTAFSASIFDSSDPVSSSSSSARLLFTSIADEYYHGFKIMSDHLHGWGDDRTIEG